MPKLLKWVKFCFPMKNHIKQTKHSLYIETDHDTCGQATRLETITVHNCYGQSLPDDVARECHSMYTQIYVGKCSHKESMCSNKLSVDSTGPRLIED